MLEVAIFATYKRQQSANDVRKAEKTLFFLPELQSKVATNCDNSSGG